jgi:hypothetical protein
MAGLFENIVETIKEAKKEGKLQYGLRYNPDLKVGGGYYDDNKMFEVDVDRDGVNLMFRKKFDKGGKVYTNRGGVTLSTEKNVKEGFIYPIRNNKGEIRWRKTSGGTKRKTNYDFTKKAPLPEMDNNRFKFDIDLNQWVYLGRDKDNPIIVKKENETFKEFLKRKEDTRFAKMEKSRNKRIDRVVDAKNKVDDWTTKWLDKNLNKYGIRDDKKFLNNLKKDYEKFVNKTFKTRMVGGTNLFSKDNLPNVSRSITERLKPFEYENFKTINIGKYGGKTDIDYNPTKRIDNAGFFKKVFFKNRVENIPGFKDDLLSYFNYITTNKATKIGREATKNFVPNKDVVYFLDTKQSKMSDTLKGDLMVALGDEVKTSYDKYQYRVRAGLNWVKNAELIEKTLGPKEMKRLTGYTKIKAGMDAESKILKKIFDYTDLPNDLKLSYAIDHGQGISFAAKSGNKNTMKLAVTDLIGTTNQTNEYLGRGKSGEPQSFERQRSILANKIRKKQDVTNNLKKLNKLVENTYGTKNVYSIKNGILNSSKISPTTNAASRFISYFEEIDKTKEGKAAIKKQYGDLNRLKTLIKQNSKDIQTVKNYALNNKGVTFNSFAGFIDFTDMGFELPPSVKQAATRVLNTSGTLLRGVGKAAVVIDPLFAAIDAGEAFRKGAGGKTAGKYVAESFFQDLINLPTTVAGAGKFVSDYAKGKRGDDLKFEGDLLYTPKTFADENLQEKLDSMSKAEKLRNMADLKFDQTGMTMVDDMEIPPSKAEVDAAREANRKNLMGPYYKYGIESLPRKVAKSNKYDIET